MIAHVWPGEKGEAGRVAGGRVTGSWAGAPLYSAVTSST